MDETSLSETWRTPCFLLNSLLSSSLSLSVHYYSIKIKKGLLLTFSFILYSFFICFWIIVAGKGKNIGGSFGLKLLMRLRINQGNDTLSTPHRKLLRGKWKRELTHFFLHNKVLLFLECYCFLLGFVIVFECGGYWDDRFFIQHLSIRFKCQRVHVWLSVVFV